MEKLLRLGPWTTIVLIIQFCSASVSKPYIEANILETNKKK